MLKPRLQKIYELINHDSNHVVDIGADHAFLSIELIKNNKVNHVTNVEKNQPPLDNGFNNAKKYGLLDKISFVLNDGLKDLVLSSSPDYICISGMGADNIIEILSTKGNNISKNYLLQANTDIYKLRHYLFTNGYEIVNEELVFENGYYYEIIHALPTNKNCCEFCNQDLYIGPILKTCSSNDLKLYLTKKYQYFSNLPIHLISNELQKEYYTIKEFVDEKKWIN